MRCPVLYFKLWEQGLAYVALRGGRLKIVPWKSVSQIEPWNSVRPVAYMILASVDVVANSFHESWTLFTFLRNTCSVTRTIVK
jgi:hypothetical protein